MVDYYTVLGVRPEASYQDIFKAYRRLAAKYHPDRGGSHDDMVRINEAWYILSDAERRRIYDQARAEHATSSQSRSFQEEMNDARQRAAEYPETWSDFLGWLKSGVKEDILGAKYSEDGDVEGSKLVWIVALLGTFSILGGLAMIGIFEAHALFETKLMTGISKIPRFGIIASPWFLFLIVVMGAFGIAYSGGCWFHRGLRCLVVNSSAEVKDDRNRTTSGKRILTCTKCKKSLRVPDVEQTLMVKCPACGNQFEASGYNETIADRDLPNLPKLIPGSDRFQAALLVVVLGLLYASGIVAGVYKVFAVGFHHGISEEKLAETRSTLVGTWEMSIHMSASEWSEAFGEADDGFAGGVTLSRVITYEVSGKYTSQGEMIIYGVSDAGSGHLSFSLQDSGSWSIDAESGRRMIHWDVANVHLAPSNDLARQLARQDPQGFREMQSALYEGMPMEIVELNQDELRTRDPESGLEITERRRPAR